MIIVTTAEVTGRQIRSELGVAMGNTIRSKNVFRDIGAGLKSIVGGELKDYTTMMTDARVESMDRMVEHARQLGADAIVNVRFTTSTVIGGAAELLAYGTAVTLD